MRYGLVDSTVLDTGIDSLVFYHKDGRMLHVLIEETATSVANQVNNDNLDSNNTAPFKIANDNIK